MRVADRAVSCGVQGRRLRGQWSSAGLFSAGLLRFVVAVGNVVRKWYYRQARWLMNVCLVAQGVLQSCSNERTKQEMDHTAGWRSLRSLRLRRS